MTGGQSTVDVLEFRRDHADAAQKVRPLWGLERALIIPNPLRCLKVLHAALVLADLAEQVSDALSKHCQVQARRVAALLLLQPLLKISFGRLNDPALQPLCHGAVEAMEAGAFLDQLQDPLAILGHRGLCLLHLHRSQGRPHLADATAEQRPTEVCSFLWRHGDDDLLLQGGRRVHLKVAPHALDVEGVVPWCHHCNYLSNAGHAVAEGFLEVLERHGLSCRLRLLHPVLIDTKAAHPGIRPLRIEVGVLAILDQGVGNVAHLVAPGVAEHERCAGSLVSSLKAVHICRARPAIARAQDLLALLSDHVWLDLVDFGISRERCGCHLLLQGCRDVVHTNGPVPLAQALLGVLLRLLFCSWACLLVRSCVGVYRLLLRIF
mmetsp:Transcript_32383/g.74839  ORF Transcript_32383/g.74839 Transcript_32383/m.74839 type:complete len:378 (-) Transcript_32383:54-1187(-)